MTVVKEASLFTQACSAFTRDPGERAGRPTPLRWWGASLGDYGQVVCPRACLRCVWCKELNWGDRVYLRVMRKLTRCRGCRSFTDWRSTSSYLQTISHSDITVVLLHLHTRIKSPLPPQSPTSAASILQRTAYAPITTPQDIAQSLSCKTTHYTFPSFYSV